MFLNSSWNCIANQSFLALLKELYFYSDSSKYTFMDTFLYVPHLWWLHSFLFFLLLHVTLMVHVSNHPLCLLPQFWQKSWHIVAWHIGVEEHQKNRQQQSLCCLWKYCQETQTLRILMADTHIKICSSTIIMQNKESNMIYQLQQQQCCRSQKFYTCNIAKWSRSETRPRVCLLCPEIWKLYCFYQFFS